MRFSSLHRVRDARTIAALGLTLALCVGFLALRLLTPGAQPAEDVAGSPDDLLAAPEILVVEAGPASRGRTAPLPIPVVVTMKEPQPSPPPSAPPSPTAAATSQAVAALPVRTASPGTAAPARSAQPRRSDAPTTPSPRPSPTPPPGSPIPSANPPSPTGPAGISAPVRSPVYPIYLPDGTIIYSGTLVRWVWTR